MFEELLKMTDKDVTSDRNYGLVKGVVRQNYDKEQPGMVKVEYQIGEDGKMVTDWIPVMSPYVAKEGGVFYFPEVDTEVIIAFLMGKTDCPVVIGSLWNKKLTRDAKSVTEKNTVKLIKTAGGNSIEISDEEKKEKITVTTKGELTLMMDDEKKTVTVKDKDGKNKLEINTDKGETSFTCDKKFSVKIGSTEFTMEKSKISIASQDVDIQAKSGFKAKGQNTNLEGTNTTVKASGQLQLSASGVAQLKGSMVKLN